jgi:hypothetical protein
MKVEAKQLILQSRDFFMKFRGPQGLGKQTTKSDGLPHGAAEN